MNKHLLSLCCVAMWAFSTSAHAQSANTNVTNATNSPDTKPASNAAPYKLSLQLSPYTQHWSRKDPEDRDVFLVGLEREHPNGKIDGFSLFSNTFGQESAYLFPWGGVYKGIWGVPKLSFKWTAGVIYGYKAPFEKKVPLNFKGFSPGFIPALAYEFDNKWSAQVNVLGTQGVMFMANVPIN